MSTTASRRAAEFLQIADQFRLGELVTESPHPLTDNLTALAADDVQDALRVLFEVDADVLRVFEGFVASGRIEAMAGAISDAIQGGRKVFFTGCGSTGRLSILLEAMWRDFWQREQPDSALENQVLSVMAGGDYALIKAVEGFEDYTSFGRRQIADLGLAAGDVVIAVTEGGETSFVIGTAWEGLDRGAKVYFVYNNPDDVLCRVVERSRRIIEEPRIEKVNLTTGPMAICGSTRMQATSIHLAVLASVLESVIRRITGKGRPEASGSDLLGALREMHAALLSPEVLEPLGRLVSLEEDAYRVGGKCNYYADHFGIDVLTDTTERSPTYCIPPFRKNGDGDAADSWAFLYVPECESDAAWKHILKREPRCVHWSDGVLDKISLNGDAPKIRRILAGVSSDELMRFRIGTDGMADRPIRSGDGAIGVLAPGDSGHFQMSCLLNAEQSGASIGVVSFRAGEPPKTDLLTVHVPCPEGPLLLRGVERIGLKMLLNALSTCVMVRLGRTMGNTMLWVVPSNLKLIDRSVRYVSHLTGMDYSASCRSVFEAIEYVEPRMKADQSYPPVVGLAVLRAREGLAFGEAERRFR